MYSIPKYCLRTNQSTGAPKVEIIQRVYVLQYVSETVHVADSATMCNALYMKKPVVSRASAGWTEGAGTGAVCF